MNPYKNLYEKVKALLKIDDNLTKAEAEQQQWQLLVKVADFTFYVGKGGVTTMFFSQSSTSRATCYPEEMLPILKELSESKVFVYVAYDRKKKPVGYSYSIEIAQSLKGAKTIKAVNFKGKKKKVAIKEKDLHDNVVWQKIGK